MAILVSQTSGTHCLTSNFPVPENMTSPGRVNVRIGESRLYACDHGLKFDSNFSMTHQTATCEANNAWLEPTSWDKCVRSKMLL